MPERAYSPADLTRLLDRLRLPQAGATSTSAEVTQAQVDLLLARIAALTEVLRTAEYNDTTRLANRILLGDVASVAGQFRGRANETAESLTSAIEGIRTVLEELTTQRER